MEIKSAPSQLAAQVSYVAKEFAHALEIAKSRNAHPVSAIVDGVTLHFERVDSIIAEEHLLPMITVYGILRGPLSEHLNANSESHWIQIDLEKVSAVAIDSSYRPTES